MHQEEEKQQMKQQRRQFKLKEIGRMHSVKTIKKRFINRNINNISSGDVYFV
jgi:hypothetical protein